jgi:RHS repeat-associated protein
MSYNVKDQTSTLTPPMGSALSMTYAGSSQVDRLAQGTRTFENSALGVVARTIPGQGTTAYTREDSGRIVGQRAPDGGRDYFLFDGLGSVIGITNSSGQVVRGYRYDPYGRTIASGGSTETPWRFAGEYLDQAGLYKIGHRYYDPNDGRWTQRDPLMQLYDPRQGNRYPYVGGDPVNLIDPSGMLLDDLFGDGPLGKVWGCVNPVGDEDLAGAAGGATIGFTLGTASASELGEGAVGVGAVSGAAGAKLGHTAGGVYGCGKDLTAEGLAED